MKRTRSAEVEALNVMLYSFDFLFKVRYPQNATVYLNASDIHQTVVTCVPIFIIKCKIEAN